jgi:hypothetical protein
LQNKLLFQLVLPLLKCTLLMEQLTGLENLIRTLFFFLLKVFLLTPPLSVTKGDNVNVSFSMVRSKENHRLMDMEFTYELHELSGRKHPAVKTKMYLE